VALKSTIEWTEATWNPVTGCDKVSPGCKHCYAERMALRLQAMGQPRYSSGFQVRLHPDLVDLPRTWRAPRLIFVNSMSDLFHEAVPYDFIRRVFETMTACPQHTFQILTKRSRRLTQLADFLPWPANIWIGVSVESERYVWRAYDLITVPACIRFVSAEPLLGPVMTLPLDKIDWVIAGGESGPGCRPMQAEWVRSLRDQCLQRGVPFFFKQWGGVWKKRNGRVLDGRPWEQMPRPRRV
jgi:protein gp37